MPLEASTRSPPSVPASASVSSVQTPVAMITWRARTSNRRPLSRSSTMAPVTVPPSVVDIPTTWVRDAAAAPYSAAVRTSVITRRASSTVAGHMSVQRQCAAATVDAREGVVERDARPDEGPLPQAVLERDRLLTELAPHLVRPVSFLY